MPCLHTQCLTCTSVGASTCGNPWPHLMLLVKLSPVSGYIIYHPSWTCIYALYGQAALQSDLKKKFQISSWEVRLVCFAVNLTLTGGGGFRWPGFFLKTVVKLMGCIYTRLRLRVTFILHWAVFFFLNQIYWGTHHVFMLEANRVLE